MISSMQKNKKWLLPTIWISTIAFVGAGFVGWGSYKPSMSSSSVASVGAKEITMKDLNLEYSNLYSQYQQALGNKFNDELAKQLNLQSLAFENVVQKNLLLNLSDEFGFTVSDEEVYKELLNIPSFLKDGKFDTKTYKEILKRNRTTPSEFEQQIKQNILVNKIQDVFKADVNNETIKTLNELFFSSDKAQINIINSKDIDLNVSDDDIKAYYEKNKQNYKSIKKYEVNVAKIKIGEDEKVSKKEALKKYLNLKKAKDSFTNKEILDVNSDFLSIEEQNVIFDSSINSVQKPIKVNNEFVIYQLTKIIEPQVLSFDTIKDKVASEFKTIKTKELLNAKKDKLLKNFNGVDIDYITKGKLIKIDGLNEKEVNILSQQISTSTSLINFVQLEDKIVVFKILDTKLANYDKTKDIYLKDTIIKLKSNQMLTSLIEKLKNKYEIKSNFKVN